MPGWTTVESMRSGDMRRRRWWDTRSIVGTSTRASVGCALPLQDVRSAPQPSARLVDDRVGERAALGERRRSPGVLPTEMFGDLAIGPTLDCQIQDCFFVAAEAVQAGFGSPKFLPLEKIVFAGLNCSGLRGV